MSAQRSKSFWSSKACRTSLRQDILIDAGQGCKFVLHTKWKRPVDNKLSSSELQQLLPISGSLTLITPLWSNPTSGRACFEGIMLPLEDARIK